MRGSRWRHPLTIAVVTGLIALVGTIGAAVISSSGGSDDEPTSETDRAADSAAGPPAEDPAKRAANSAAGPPAGDAAGIAIQNITFAPRSDGTGVMTVRGVARGLGKTDSLYAIAKPRGSARGQRWFVSDAKTPGRAGRWSASIDVDEPTRQPLTVVAVQVQGCAPGTACGDPTLDRYELEASGPRSHLVDMRSRPVTTRD